MVTVPTDKNLGEAGHVADHHTINAALTALATGSSLAGGSSLLAWATTTVYPAGYLVTQGGYVYISTTAHTAGTFATDLGAGKWVQVGVDPAVVGNTELIFVENRTNRTFTDGVMTSGSAAISSAAAAAFSTADVGRAVSGTGIPASTTILSVTDATHATMSANATASASGVSITIGNFTATATNTYVDVPGLSAAVPASTRPVWGRMSLLCSASTASALCSVQIAEVSNGVDTPIMRGTTMTMSAAAGGFVPILLAFRIASSTARTRTFKLQVAPNSGGATLTVYVPTATNNWDCYHAYEAR